MDIDIKNKELIRKSVIRFGILKEIYKTQFSLKQPRKLHTNYLSKTLDMTKTTVYDHCSYFVEKGILDTTIRRDMRKKTYYFTYKGANFIEDLIEFSNKYDFD